MTTNWTEEYDLLSFPSGAWSPSDIPSIVSWYRGDLGITLNGSNVSDWADQEGNNDLTQATAADQPALTSADANFNNKDVVLFPGSTNSDHLAISSFSTLTQPFFICVVANHGSNGGGGFPRPFASNDGTNKELVLHEGSTDMEINAGTQLLSSGNNYTVPDSNPSIHMGLFNGGSSQTWRNGVSQATGNAGTGVLNSTTGFRVGNRGDGTRCWDGSIALLVVVNANPSTSDKNLLGNYAADLYGGSWTDIT